jgi:hypothetical protein
MLTAAQQREQLRNQHVQQQQVVSDYRLCNTYTFTQSVVSISGTGLVTANSDITPSRKLMQRDSGNYHPSIVVNTQPATPLSSTAGR